MNWVDWMIVGFLAISVIGGFAEGFVRIAIGFAALIFGFLFASWFHGVAGGWVEPYIHTKAVASLSGFLIIFIGILVLGALIAAVINRVFKIVGLSWLDRLIGGAFGAVRGVLVLAIAALLLSAFFPKSLPAATSQSQLAPYVFSASKLLSAITPYEIKNGFEQAYQDLRVLIDGVRKKRVPVTSH